MVKEMIMPPEKEAKKESPISMSNISLWIDHYDDIFSDFDPRPYSQRDISDDFIIEAKKVARDRVSGVTELRILVPETQRNRNLEAIIKRRLREYFQKIYRQTKEDVKKVLKEGGIFIISGIVFMMVATFMIFAVGDRNIWVSFLIVILEPAGWFLFWEGLNMFWFDVKKTRPEREFYKKMSKCSVTFVEYKES
jgi:hypothetical protein